jgi:quercetin dioxygenase-like cupin family protein
MSVLRWAERDHRAALPGITASLAVGEHLSAALFRLEPGAVVPEHSHDNEEFGQVISGSLELTADGRTVTLHTGDGFLLPPGVRHGALAGAEGCELLECYAPPRDPVPPPTAPSHRPIRPAGETA